MELLNWAENEIRVALAKAESVDSEDSTAIEDGNYYKECCLSALSAFRSLCSDGHSGMSIQITKNILDTLIDGRPLTPIEDEDEVWNFVTEHDEEKLYQCKRMSSLFKTVDKNGEVSFSDINRVVCIDSDNPNNTYYSKLVTNIVDEMYPIIMPYNPTRRHFNVRCQDILSDPNNGDFDTIDISELTTPNMEVVKINRYFKASNDGWEEIDGCEWGERLAMHQQRLENLKHNEV